jgi:hypothetical protein
MRPVEPQRDLFLETLLRRALAGADLLPVFFQAEVLDAYQTEADEILRSDTAGRLRRRGSFSLDFGIAPGEELIHVALEDLRARLPEKEWPHWLAHAVSLPYSTNFLQMRLRPGSCFDDGEIRPWRRKP